MFLTAFLTLSILFLAFLLLAPLVLYVDTATNEYYIQLKGLAKASIEGHEKEVLRIRLHVFFLNFYFYPLRSKSLSKRKKIGQKNTKKRRKRIGIAKGLKLLKSFRVKRLLVDIDTGDCITNAKLYPAFAFLNHYLGSFNINFEGRNRMVLLLQNRPIRIIKSFLNI